MTPLNDIVPAICLLLLTLSCLYQTASSHPQISQSEAAQLRETAKMLNINDLALQKGVNEYLKALAAEGLSDVGEVVGQESIRKSREVVRWDKSE